MQNANQHAQPPSKQPHSGQAIFEQLASKRLIGIWQDREETNDPAEFARKLRELAQGR